MVVDSNGQLLGKLNANELLDSASNVELNETQLCSVSFLYEKFLLENLQK